MQFVQINRGMPRPVSLLGSVFAHLLAGVLLASLVALQRSRPVIVPPVKGETQTVPAEPVTIPPSQKQAGLSVSHQKKSKKIVQKVQSPGDSAMGLATLRREARRATAAIVQNFKFRTTYGFSPFPKYELAFQTSGQIPIISADLVPPHFEQYVIVEVTIDSQGSVADARITAGEVDNKIASTLLSAIRQFKYRPATREGVPIPSQCDLVIHIPT
jgi:TonB family protein